LYQITNLLYTIGVRAERRCSAATHCRGRIALVVEIPQLRPRKHAGSRGVVVATRVRQRINGNRSSGAVDLGALNGHVVFNLRRAQSAVFGDFVASLARLELRPAQYTLLEVVDARPGLRQSDAAAILGIEKANFVSLVHGLERRALLRRSRSDVDRRAYALHLGPAGTRLLKRARGLHHAHESKLTERLGPKGRDDLLGLLTRLAAP
jgi:DNA-binding MarR family transcriptional regulator